MAARVVPIWAVDASINNTEYLEKCRQLIKRSKEPKKEPVKRRSFHEQIAFGQSTILHVFLKRRLSKSNKNLSLYKHIICKDINEHRYEFYVTQFLPDEEYFQQQEKIKELCTKYGLIIIN